MPLVCIFFSQNTDTNKQHADIETVDIYSDHFYPINVTRLISDAQVVVQHNKSFLVGEYHLPITENM